MIGTANVAILKCFAALNALQVEINWFTYLPGSEHKLELTYSPDYEVHVAEDLVHTCIRVANIEDYCAYLESLQIRIDLWPSNWRDKFKSGKEWLSQQTQMATRSKY